MSFKNEKKKIKRRKRCQKRFFCYKWTLQSSSWMFHICPQQGGIKFHLVFKLYFLVSPDDATLKASICKKSNLILLALLLEVFLSEAAYVPYLPGLRGGGGGVGGGRGGWRAKTWLKCRSRDTVCWIRLSRGSLRRCRRSLGRRPFKPACRTASAKGHLAFMFLNHCVPLNVGRRQCRQTALLCRRFLFRAPWVESLVEAVAIATLRNRFWVLEC